MMTDQICPEPVTLIVAPVSQAVTAKDFSPTPGLVQSPATVSHFTPILTLVLWLGCSVVAALGVALPYVRPHAAPAQPGPLQVEMLNVELSNDPLPDPEPAAAASLATPPLATMLPPQPVSTVAVALPSPSIAFALPVEAPARVVSAGQADYARPAVTETSTTAAAPVVQPLVFGRGEGKQPAPDYPAAAERARQEGSVGVRFVVAENGRVSSAEAVAPSAWSLLNDSAVRTIRNRWRFPTGRPRVYEVAIRFVLPK